MDMIYICQIIKQKQSLLKIKHCCFFNKIQYLKE